MKKMINVLIVDDSKTCTASLYTILNVDPNIQVIACAEDGLQAVTLTKKLKPDIVTMDIFMPKMDGVEATRVIMEECPTPILVISAPPANVESNRIFDALEAGALSIIEKPNGVEKDFDKISQQILNAVRTLANVHVYQREKSKQIPKISKCAVNKLGAKILALGSSTGGPEALRRIISALPVNFSIPIVITQHITKGFLPGLIYWLKSVSKLNIQIANDNQKLLPGSVYSGLKFKRSSEGLINSHC